MRTYFRAFPFIIIGLVVCLGAPGLRASEDDCSRAIKELAEYSFTYGKEWALAMDRSWDRGREQVYEVVQERHPGWAEMGKAIKDACADGQ